MVFPDERIGSNREKFVLVLLLQRSELEKRSLKDWLEIKSHESRMVRLRLETGG